VLVDEITVEMVITHVSSTESIGPATAAEVQRAASANEKRKSDRMLKRTKGGKCKYKKSQRNVDIKSGKRLERAHSHAEWRWRDGTNLI
jgi:hypothetical protein